MTGAPCAVPTDNIFWCHLFLGGAVLHLPHRLNTPRELGPAQPEDSQCESKNQVIVSTLACIERRISGIAEPHTEVLQLAQQHRSIRQAGGDAELPRVEQCLQLAD